MQIATANNGIRAAGTSGYDASADYVASQLSAMGYDVDHVPFHFSEFADAAPVELIVGDQRWSGSEWLNTMLYSASGDVTGVVQTVKLTPDGRQINTGGCDPADWSDFVAGNIALIESGPCARRDQILNAVHAGAIALISLYPNWAAGQTRRPTLLSQDGVTIPTIVAGSDPTQALLAAAAGGATAQVVTNTTITPAVNDDVIAEWPGTGDQVVMLGAHLDSVIDGPGINDNGSGVATLLSLARSVTGNPRPDETIRFGFWGAEEYGELGSAAYVSGLPATELDRLTAYFNLDMVASPNAARFVYDDSTAPPGSDQLTQMLLGALSAADKPGLLTDLGGASDHLNFELAGIPSAGVFSGINPPTDSEAQVFGNDPTMMADACYHLACDTRANINMDSALTLGGAVTTVVQDLAYQP
jgi:Peptidase family M28/PA domain